MLQAAGDLGFDQKPGPADRVVGVTVENLLEGDLAIQLAIKRHEDRPEPPLRMRPQDPEPLTFTPGRGNNLRDCGVLVGSERGPLRDDRGQVGLTQRGGFHQGTETRGDRSQRFLGIATMESQLLLGHCRQEGSALVVDRAPIDEDLGQGPGPRSRPGPEGPDQLILVNQANLQGQQPKQEIPRRLVDSGHERWLPIAGGPEQAGRVDAVLIAWSHAQNGIDP